MVDVVVVSGGRNMGIEVQFLVEILIVWHIGTMCEVNATCGPMKCLNQIIVLKVAGGGS